MTVLLAVFLLIAPSAFAQQNTNAVLETLKALDTDGSGKVEHREVLAFAQAQGLTSAEVEQEFMGLDANGDGDLEPEELNALLGGESTDVSESKAAPASKVAEVQQKRTELVAEKATKPVAVQRTDVPKQAAAAIEVALPRKASVAPATLLASSSEEATLASQAASTGESSAVDLERLQLDAQQQAARTVAQVFMQRSEAILQQRERDEAGAKQLEDLAAQLRANATALVASASKEAEQAALRAAGAEAKKALDEAREMEERAASLEAKSKQSRAESEEAMQKAARAQAEMMAAVQKLRSGM